MTFKHTDLGIELYAEDDMAICPKATHDPIVESVLLSHSDSPENWMDCEKEFDENIGK